MTRTLRGQFQRHRTRQLDDSRFGCVVVRVEGMAHDAVGGGGIENDAAAVLRHVARRGLRHMEDAGQVYGENPLPFFRRDVEKLVTNADARVVDDDVQPIQRDNDIAESLLHLPAIRHVGQKSPADPWKILANPVAEAFIAIENSHARAFLQKARGGGGSDAAGASGDDHSFALESAHRLFIAK